MELIWQCKLCAMPRAGQVVRASPCRGIRSCRLRLKPMLEPGNAIHVQHLAIHTASMRVDHDCEPRPGKHRGPLRSINYSGCYTSTTCHYASLGPSHGAHVPIHSKGQGTIRGRCFCAGEEPPRIARFLITTIGSLPFEYLHFQFRYIMSTFPDAHECEQR